MQYNYEETVDHRHDGSYRREQPAGREDILGMGTADLDYVCAPCVRQAALKVSEENTFNYRRKPDTYYSAVGSWFHRKYGMEVPREWVRELPSTIGAIRLALGVYCKPGDSVLMQTPYFGPIRMAIEGAGCVFLENPMRLRGERYELDLADFEEKLKRHRPSMFLLVNPHNPTGRVFTSEELQAMVNLCARYQVKILSDEVHSLILYEGLWHTPILAVSERAREISIQLFSFSKGFNTMSVPHALLLIADEEMRRRWDEYLLPFDFHYASNSFSIAIVTALASGRGDHWLEQVTKYLRRNRDLFSQLVEEKELPILPLRPEAGYLFWIDCRNSGVEPEELGKVFWEKAGISLNNGLDHGEEGRGFVRLNFGVTERVLREAVARMENLFHG